MSNKKPPMNMNIDLSAAEDVVCSACGNGTFVEVTLMKKLSAIVSPTGKEAIVPLPSFACNACGWVNREFMPALPKKVETQDQPQERPKLTLET